MKFSIRDLLLVTVIAAVCVAWWLDHRRQAAALAKEKEGHVVYYDNLAKFFSPAPNRPSK